MNKKIYLIGLVFAITLFVIGGIMLTRKKIAPKKSNPESQLNVTVIPTIDASVVVNLIQTIPGREVQLSIKGIPKTTLTIEYELSYQTAKQGLQGVIGTISLADEEEFEKKLTLGTCSSGTCVYHQVVGKINSTLKFTGEYGEKLFEKEFEL